MKIRSITDVITNSSTEVFAIRPGNSSLRSLRKTLSEIGFCQDDYDLSQVKPGKDPDHVLEEMLKFGYLISPGDKEAHQGYVLEGAWCSKEVPVFDPDGNVVTVPSDYPESSLRLAQYLMDHREEFLADLKSRSEFTYQTALDDQVFDSESPLEFLEKTDSLFLSGILGEVFLGRYLESIGSTLEQEFPIPRPLRLESFYGKIFLWIPESSEIDETTEERLRQVIDVSHKWHLG